MYMPAIKALNYHLKSPKLVYVVIFDYVDGKIHLKEDMRKRVQSGTHICITFSVNKRIYCENGYVIDIPLVPGRDLRNVYIDYIVNRSINTVSLIFAGTFSHSDFVDLSNTTTKSFTILPESISFVEPHRQPTIKDVILTCFVHQCDDIDAFCKRYHISRILFSKWLNSECDTGDISAKVMTWILILSNINHGKLNPESKSFTPEMRIHIRDLRTISLITVWNRLWKGSSKDFCRIHQLQHIDFHRWLRVQNRNYEFEHAIEKWICCQGLIDEYIREESRKFQLCIA